MWRHCPPLAVCRAKKAVSPSRAGIWVGKQGRQANGQMVAEQQQCSKYKRVLFNEIELWVQPLSTTDAGRSCSAHRAIGSEMSSYAYGTRIVLCSYSVVYCTVPRT